MPISLNKIKSMQSNTPVKSSGVSLKKIKELQQKQIKVSTENKRNRFTQEEIQEFTKPTVKKPTVIDALKELPKVFTNKNLQQKIRQPVWDAIGKASKANEVIAEGLGSTLIGSKPAEGITTGNKDFDKVLRAAGALETVFLPTGGLVGGVNNLAGGAIREASEGLVKKATMKTSSKILSNPVVQKAAVGAVESVPYTAQQIDSQKLSKKEALKTAAFNTALGAIAEPVIMGASALLKKGTSKANKILEASGTKPTQPLKQTKQVNIPLQNKTAQNSAQIPEQFKGAEPGDINYKPVKVGAQVQVVKNPMAQKTQKFTYADLEIEKVHLQNKGVSEETTVQKVKQGIADAVNMFKRPIGTLPYTKENAELYKDLIKLPKIRSIASDDTVRVLDDISKELDKNSFDMFERKVLLDDLVQEASLGNKLPNKWTPESVQFELARLDQAMPQAAKNAIKKRVEYWNTLKSEYTTALRNVGVNIDGKLDKENYFRHQVLDYINAKNSIIGTGKKLKTPANRSFTQGRSGMYEGNINTDYLQSEFEVMAQMKHDIEVAKTIKNIDANYNIADKVKADAKAQGLGNWKDAIPEGYTTWQPREGNVFFMSQPLGAEIVEQSLAMRGINLKSIKDFKLKVALEDIMNDLADQTGVLAVGGKRKEFVVKQEVADTLNNMTKTVTTNALSKISKSVQNAWKSWVLVLNPKSVIKYNIRNFSGDLDAVIAGNPGTLKKIPKASKELYDVLINGKFTPELKSWYDRGGYQSLLYAQEISQVSKLKPFERFKGISLSDKITKPLRKYAEFTKSATNYREATSRYAAYLDYVDQLKSGNLKNYGASRPEIVDGIKGVEDKAFKLSNDLLGAYDEVSQAGQVIRNHIIPFYSWMEINMKRYKNLFKNAFTNKEAGKVAGLSAGVVAKLGVKTATKLVGIFAMTSALAAWNQLKYADLEETLPEDVRNTPHIILGQDKNGNTQYFSRLGSFNDFLGWFGLDSAPQDMRDIMNGKQTVEEFLSNAIKSPVNKVVGGVTPAFKTPAELLTGQKLYPDAFEPSTIRDKRQYAAQSLGLKNEYDVVAGKPTRPYFESLSDAVMYKADPQEQAYYSVLDLKAKYKEDKLGIKRTGGMYATKKSDALYNWKLAIRYKDNEARKKYLKEYFKLGGTEEGLNTSLKSLNPLSGLNADQQVQFVTGLTGKEKDKLKEAMKYYQELLKPKK